MFSKKSLFGKFLLVLILLGLTAIPVFAQQSDFNMGISRTFGYGNGDQIRGTFTLYISGGTNIQSVQFMIDGKTFSTVTSAPFRVPFETTSYSEGNHDLGAVIQTTDGQKVVVAPLTENFVSAADESSGMVSVIVPILGIVVVVALAGVLLQVFFFKKKFANMPPGTARNYGFRGGTVCPRCHRPYSIHLWSLNIGIFTRLDRCDFCGKWALVRRISMEDLHAAEQKELESFENNKPVVEKTEEEKLRELLDKSKYTDQ